MRVEVQFFSQLQDVAGAPGEAIDLCAGATVADLLLRLYHLHPGLEKWDRQILIGSGVEFVERAHALQVDEQIAIMPPVQGG